MKILAGIKPTEISTALEQKSGSPNERRYDSCYYEIMSSITEEQIKNYSGDKKDGLRLHIQIT